MELSSRGYLNRAAGLCLTYAYRADRDKRSLIPENGNVDLVQAMPLPLGRGRFHIQNIRQSHDARRQGRRAL